MKRTMKLKRFLSGMMAAITLLSSVLPSGMVYAEDTNTQEYPLYEEVKDLLSADEVVKAEDIQLDKGVSFDVAHDFTGLEIPDKEKVKVELHEAKNSNGENFSTDHADTYKSVYYVEPVSGNPSYQVQRNIVVTEVPLTETETAVSEVVSETEGGLTEESNETEEEPDSQEVHEEVMPTTETESNAEIQTETATEETEEIQTETVTEEAKEIQTEAVTEEAKEIQTEAVTEEAKEIQTENITEVSSEAVEEIESETATEAEMVTETETETETVTETVEYQVKYSISGFYKWKFNKEELLYKAGETVSFSVVMQDGIQPAYIYAMSVSEENKEIDLSYNSENALFSFIMPESDVKIFVELGQNGAMLLGEAANEDPVPDQFKLINTGSIAMVPESYQSSALPGAAATQIRKVVFIDDDGSEVTRWAFCLQPYLDTPPGGTYAKDSEQVEVLETGSKEKSLAKCLYYMYGGPAWGKTIDYTDGSGSINMKTLLENNGCSTTEHFFAVTHYMLGYIYVGANGNWNANSGVENVMNSVGEEKIALFVNYIKKLPVPRTELTKTSVTSTSTAGVSVSETVTYKAIDANTATIKLPDGITLVNKTTGERNTGTVKISGGTKFYLEADPSVTGTKTYTLSCKYAVDFTAMALKTEGKQDVGFSYYSGDKKLTLSVAWPDQAEVSITKKDAVTGVNLAGAVYGIYSDKACTNLIIQMPETDSKGTSSVSLNKTQDIVYLKEITAPKGYMIDTTAHNIELVAGGTVTKMVTDTPQLAGITIYKEGESLTGANISDAGVTFLYEKKRLPGAVYQITAGEDIKNASGTVVYKKGAVVADGLTTGTDGSVTVNNLHLGTYVVTEKAAPANYVNKGESKTLTLTYAGQNETAVFGSVTFENERKKAEVSVIKRDASTETPLSGAVYGLYAGTDISNVNGNVVVQKNTLLERVTTAENGTAVFTADLPAGNSYYVKELQAPDQYLLNATDVFSFSFTDAECESAVTKFSYCFRNKEAKGSITVYKEGEALTDANVSGSGVTFLYEKKRLSGAVYRLTAGEDIKNASGTVVYKKGAVVKDNLTTGTDGSVTVNDLYLGTYVVTEKAAPANYINKGEAKTLTLTYAGQNETAVFETVTFENERKKAKVLVVKQDETTATPLAGAAYGLYAGTDICNVNGKVVVSKDTLLERVVTAENGTAVFAADLPVGNVYYVKELQAPDLYLLNATDVFSFSFTDAECENAVTEFYHCFKNKEVKGSLTIYKEGEVLTDAEITENGVSFLYETRKQKGAIYDVYAGEDIKSAVGTVIYKKDELIAENLITGEDGSVTLDNLYLGTYVVKEVQAPKNYINKEEAKTVTISYAGQNTEIVFAETVFTNERQRAEVTVSKKDQDTGNPLTGGIYGLYAGSNIQNADGEVVVPKDTLIEKAVTDSNGSAVYTSDLPVGNSYYLKELQAPENYYRNTNDVYFFTFDYSHDREFVQSFEHTFTNERVDVSVQLVKKDVETGTAAQGDAILKGAVYGLYAREDIVHPDGKTGVVFQADTQVAVLTTDAEGKAEITGLYLGSYYIKEITPSTGYLLDETQYDILCSYEGDMTKTVERDCTSLETVIRQPFQIIKAANNGKTDADLLEGVGFSAYLVSSLKVNADGSYDYDSAKPVVVGENGATEIFTDEKGHAVSIPLPYGTYIVRETTTPHNYTPVKDFLVRITENNPNEPQTWRVLLDDEFEAKLKIIKKDDETKKAVLSAGTEFRIYDMNTKSYVEQVTTYPTTVTHTSYFTDADGYLILPQNLKIGYYRIEEVTAPAGYTINSDYVEIKVDTDTMYQIDAVSGDVIIEVVYENHSVKGELTIVKKGEVLAGYKNDFAYEVQNLSGAVFSVYAAKDIYTADFQKDENGNRLLEYAKDTLVAELTTGADGKAVLSDLPLGVYKVVEKQAPEGFVLNTEEQQVEFVYVDQNTPVVSECVEFVNDRQKVEISIVKKDAENENTLAGAEFALYAKEDIKAGEKVLVKAEELLETAVTGEDGKAVFTKDLPFGSYYLKETAAPAGFVSNDEMVEVTVSYQGQDAEVVYQEAEFKNLPTTTEFTKSDLTTSVELEGATLTVLDKEGNVIETWTSVKEEPHVIKRLHIGETYILREEFAPYGYLKAEEVELTVADTAEIQKVEMKDDVPTGRIIINKYGEFVNEVTWNDMVTSAVEAAFGYVTGSLQGVTFEVYAMEDIKAADGVSEDYYKKDDLVTTMTTDALGFARADGLPLGKYYVVEKETAEGFVLDGEAREIDLTYRDQDTPVVTHDEDWQNNRQMAKVTVWKKEKGTDRMLEGGVFALCTKEDIVNADGKVILKADTVIEQKATDQEGKILFLADLPAGGSFYVKEVQAPDGFVTTEEIQEFDFEYAGADTAEVTFEFTFENEATVFEITKSDLVNGGEIPGARLQVTDEAGNVVDEWTSGTTPHIIKELVVGKSYMLTERIPANGYVTAESITFTVENTAKIQKVDMKDDVTKVQISKTDMTDGCPEVKGAKLYILDEEDKVMDSWISGKEPHYIEKLPIGKYTLLEESAPYGYIISERVPFEVKDTGEIQTVQMVDDTAMGKIILNKTDEQTGEAMKGVEFELCNSKGKVLETLVTDSAGHAESKLYPIAAFKNGKYKKAIVYILKETKTLDGYVLDQTEHKIKFEYVDDKTPVVEYTLDLTNEKSPEPEEPGITTFTDAPKTGDETNIAIFLIAMAVSVGCFVSLILVRKRNKQ